MASPINLSTGFSPNADYRRGLVIQKNVKEKISERSESKSSSNSLTLEVNRQLNRKKTDKIEEKKNYNLVFDEEAKFGENTNSVISGQKPENAASVLIEPGSSGGTPP